MVKYLIDLVKSVTMFEIVVVWSMVLVSYAVVVQHSVTMTVALLGHLGAALYGRVKGQI